MIWVWVMWMICEWDEWCVNVCVLFVFIHTRCACKAALVLVCFMAHVWMRWVMYEYMSEMIYEWDNIWVRWYMNDMIYEWDLTLECDVNECALLSPLCACVCVICYLQEMSDIWMTWWIFDIWMDCVRCECVCDIVSLFRRRLQLWTCVTGLLRVKMKTMYSYAWYDSLTWHISRRLLQLCSSIYFSALLSVYLSICIYLSGNVCLSICLSICLSVCLSVSLSAFIFVSVPIAVVPGRFLCLCL